MAHKNAVKSSRGETGVLTVAVDNITYDYINLGNICLQMKLQYPEVNFKVLDMPFAFNRLEYLTSGKADVAIFADSNDLTMPDGFCAKSIVPLNFALAFSCNNRLAYIENLQLNALKQEHFILPPREEAPNLRDAWDQIFMEHCHSLPIVTQEVAGYHAILQFVAAGFGVGLLFGHKHNLLSDQIILRELPVEMNRSILIGFPEDSNSPVIKNFLRILQIN